MKAVPFCKETQIQNNAGGCCGSVRLRLCRICSDLVNKVQ